MTKDKAPSATLPGRLDSRKALVANADGSIDLHFGPSAPAGEEGNWLPTLPGRGWFAYFRFYAPSRAPLRPELVAARRRAGEVTDRARGRGGRAGPSVRANPRWRRVCRRASSGYALAGGAMSGIRSRPLRR